MEYRVSRLAEHDLIDIYAYGATEFGIDQADIYQHRLRSAFESLAENPGLGRLCPEIFEGVRRLNVESHIIFYERIDAAGHSIEIVRVLHEKMDVGLHFDG